MLNMKLQSESVPENRQSWTVWESERKDRISLNKYRETSETELGILKNKNYNHDHEIEIDRELKERNSPEHSICLLNTNVNYDLNNQDILIETKAQSNMSREKKSEFKKLITNGEASTEESLKRKKLRPVRIESEPRKRNTHILDDPEPISLSLLCSVREVLRIILNVGLLLGEGCAWVTLYTMTNQEHVLIFLILPTVVSSTAWLACNWCNKQLSWSYFATVLCLLLLSVPSPVFL